jgi:hypothetical protein
MTSGEVGVFAIGASDGTIGGKQKWVEHLLDARKILVK